MQWIKQGRILEPTGQAPWLRTHAALPVVDLMSAERWRMYFSSRDEFGRSHIGWAELAAKDPRRTLGVSREPLLSPGLLGTFDDAGVTSSCLVRDEGRFYLFYTGWTRGVSVPFYLNAGVAVSDDEGRTFRRHSAAPLLDRNAVDPYLTASPWVLVESGIWRMWYVSGTQWRERPNGPQHSYHIKYAESADGTTWRRSGLACIDYGSPNEHAFGRPCVIRDAGRYRMWYSFRGDAYRIGYAESTDGIRWQRMDAEAGIDVSADGWDSEMLTYPVVWRHGTQLFMVYNGNGYGRTGVGLAVSA